MKKQISQREARALRKRVAHLEKYFSQQRNIYAHDWPGGTHLGSLSWENDKHISSAVYTARQLGHAVVVVANGSRRFDLYAIQLERLP